MNINQSNHIAQGVICSAVGTTLFASSCFEMARAFEIQNLIQSKGGFFFAPNLLIANLVATLITHSVLIYLTAKIASLAFHCFKAQWNTYQGKPLDSHITPCKS